jgi:hypothetical protein
MAALDSTARTTSNAYVRSVSFLDDGLNLAGVHMVLYLQKANDRLQEKLDAASSDDHNEDLPGLQLRRARQSLAVMRH